MRPIAVSARRQPHQSLIRAPIPAGPSAPDAICVSRQSVRRSRGFLTEPPRPLVMTPSPLVGASLSRAADVRLPAVFHARTHPPAHPPSTRVATTTVRAVLFICACLPSMLSTVSKHGCLVLLASTCHPSIEAPLARSSA